MKQEIFDRIKNDPNYMLLVQKRSRLGWQLSFIMLFIYFGFASCFCVTFCPLLSSLFL